MAEHIRQKLRTRSALLEAAQEILREGGTPRVAEVAERALVSRATAYRHFPTQEALLQEVPLDLACQSVVSALRQRALGRAFSAREGLPPTRDHGSARRWSQRKELRHV